MPATWKWLRYCSLLCCVGVAAACGSSEVTLVALPVGPSPVRLGEEIQFTSTHPEVIWIVVGGPEKGTIDPFGLYRAPATLPADPLVTILVQDNQEQAFAFVELLP